MHILVSCGCFLLVLLCPLAMSIDFMWSEESNMYEYVASDGPPGVCIWYDNCANLSNHRHSPCVDNNPARPVTDDNHMAMLTKWCPMYLKVPVEDTRTCCNYAQLVDLANEFSMMEQMLSRCPACYTNLLKLFCATACDPNQSNFIIVGETKPVTTTVHMAVPPTV